MMKSIKNLRSWGLIALIITLALIASQSPSSILLASHGPNHGTFTASSECIGTGNAFTLQNLDPNASIRLHDKNFVILNQSFQLVYQSAPGTLVNIPGTWSPKNNKHTWSWNQKTMSNTQAPVGTYLVMLAVEDDFYDPYISPQTDPAIYTATFKIQPGSIAC
jgi:hypothetical protein